MKIIAASEHDNQCSNCGSIVRLDLVLPETDAEGNPDLWTWVCPSCGARINQKVIGFDPFRVATEVVKSTIRR